MDKIVLALGFFDGIHRGHAALLEKTKQRAGELGLAPAVFTFDRHPREVVTGQPMLLINSPEDRQEILHRLFGIDRVYVSRFDQAMMHMSGEEFIRRLLHETYHAAHVVAGHDFHFGYQNQGTPQLLRQCCAELGMGCDIIPRVEREGITVSSTYIRGLLEQGAVERAGDFLGHPYGFSNTVVHGLHLGSRLGIPTVNLAIPQGTLPPRHGVYVSRVFFADGRSVSSITNVGVRPTVGADGKVNAESFLLDFSGDLYGQRLRLELYRFLRPEEKFPDLTALQRQVQRDIAKTRAYFEKA